jgi:hypothetical protein
MNINPYLIYILALLKAVNFNCILTEQIIKGENINKCSKDVYSIDLYYINPWLELDYVLNANFHFIDIYIEILTQLFIHIFF